MIRGMITSHEILRHPFLIIRLFGGRVFGRCLLGIFQAEQTTFLSLLSERSPSTRPPASDAHATCGGAPGAA
jgi:hypothetical protein